MSGFLSSDQIVAYKFTGGTSKLNLAEQIALTTHLDSHIYLMAKEVCSYVETQYNVTYTTKGMTSLLHQLGFSYKKPRHVPGKANQVAFFLQG